MRFRPLELAVPPLGSLRRRPGPRSGSPTGASPPGGTFRIRSTTPPWGFTPPGGQVDGVEGGPWRSTNTAPEGSRRCAFGSLGGYETAALGAKTDVPCFLDIASND